MPTRSPSSARQAARQTKSSRPRAGHEVVELVGRARADRSTAGAARGSRAPCAGTARGRRRRARAGSRGCPAGWRVATGASARAPSWARRRMRRLMGGPAGGRGGCVMRASLIAPSCAASRRADRPRALRASRARGEGQRLGEVVAGQRGRARGSPRRRRGGGGRAARAARRRRPAAWRAPPVWRTPHRRVEDGRHAGGAGSQAQVHVLIKQELAGIERAEPPQGRRAGHQAGRRRPSRRCAGGARATAPTRSAHGARAASGGCTRAGTNAPSVPGSGCAERSGAPGGVERGAAPTARRAPRPPAARRASPSSSSSQSGLSSAGDGMAGAREPGVVRRAEAGVVGELRPPPRRPRGRARRPSSREPVSTATTCAPGRWRGERAQQARAATTAESCSTHTTLSGRHSRRGLREHGASGTRRSPASRGRATAARPAAARRARASASPASAGSAAASAADVARRDEARAAGAEHLAHGGQVAGDHRRARGERLHRREPEALERATGARARARRGRARRARPG